MDRVGGRVNARPLLTAQDVAGMAGCHVQTLRRWVKAGSIPLEPIPGPKCPQLFRPADVARWLEGETPGTPPADQL